MCTVTFIPVGDKFFITSNRDEKYLRKRAIPPEIYLVNGSRIIYPKDEDAGGSWIATNENGKAAILLNGGFIKHISRPPYRESRGIIFLEIINEMEPTKYFMQVNLENIEPFTMIIFDSNLYECRWTGTTKYCKSLKKKLPYIWSSATLYDEGVVKKREQWFADFLNRVPYPSSEDIFNFHQFTGDGDEQNDLKMNRSGSLSTVSITGIIMEQQHCTFRYLDLKNNSFHDTEMLLTAAFREADTF